jgi:hypothetical protein
MQWDEHTYDVSWNNVLGELFSELQSSTALDSFHPASEKIFWVALVLWGGSSGFTRLSLLCFYYRLTEHIFWRRYRVVLHLTVATSVGLSVAYIITLFFACRPLSAMWSSELHPQCLNPGHFLLAASILITILELIVALLPIPVVFSLEMDRNQQWSVACLLSMGLLTTMTGAVRCYFVYKAWLSSYDLFWWSEPSWIVAEVENSIAIVSY